MWLLSDFKSLQAAGLRVLFLAAWLPEFFLSSFPCALFFSAAPNMVACCFKAKRKENHSSWQSLRFYVTFPGKWNPVVFVVSYGLEASYRSHLKWQGVNCPRVWIPGGLDHKGQSSLSSKTTVCFESEEKSLVAQSCLTLCYSWTIACQAPLSTGFPKQEYWNG